MLWLVLLVAASPLSEHPDISKRGPAQSRPFGLSIPQTPVGFDLRIVNNDPKMDYSKLAE